MIQYTHEERKALREVDWSLNVRDEFKGKSNEYIKGSLATRRNNFILMFENALRDFNFSALIRASNAFACESIIYSGFRKYDPRGAVGTGHYENIYHVDDLEYQINLYKELGYIFAVAESDIYEKSQMLPTYQWPDKVIVMFGEEGTGVRDEFIELADVVISIPQIGSVRSMNVASSAHIMIYDYMIKTGRF